MKTLLILLVIVLTPGLVFAAAQQPPQNSGSSSGSTPGVETCFGTGDVGFESNCILEKAVAEKEVSYCDMIRIPQMAQDCMGQVKRLKAV